MKILEMAILVKVLTRKHLLIKAGLKEQFVSIAPKERKTKFPIVPQNIKTSNSLNCQVWVRKDDDIFQYTLKVGFRIFFLIQYN